MPRRQTLLAFTTFYSHHTWTEIIPKFREIPLIPQHKNGNPHTSDTDTIRFETLTLGTINNSYRISHTTSMTKHTP
jgi:hypothetical protein